MSLPLDKNFKPRPPLSSLRDKYEQPILIHKEQNEEWDNKDKDH